ncbi:MAG: hypothetical protein AB8I80_17700, partial [Anaerolineae bacterium]
MMASLADARKRAFAALIEPHSEVTDAQEQKAARFLAGLSLAMAVLNAIAVVLLAAIAGAVAPLALGIVSEGAYI